MNKKNQQETPVIAEGIDTEDVLMKDATPSEVARGEYTKVVTVSLDENDPS
ncbi:hypothetical protein [Cytobacillus depressus]|uniref:hypothetical protein n=1 Tax=Cytobacillus depressus TaxID=1602942 RepID=UPI001478D0E6|nr:hypothetical protein [Cytobacillus depressus]